MKKDAVTAILRYANEKEKETNITISEENGYLILRMPEQTDYTDVKEIDFAVNLCQKKSEDTGYYVLPSGQTGLRDHSLCYFKGRQDCEVIIGGPEMTMYGAVEEHGAFTAIVTGMTYDYKLVVQVSDGQYSMFPRFILNGSAPYEPIEIKIRCLSENADYNDICHAYRDYRVEMGELIPIEERIKKYPKLKEAIQAPFIRIRMGWKPVPTPVGEQTLENEPPMKVACTFDDVEELVEECHKNGVEHAEFCLVGWNVRGHDGRWPQIFPVEPALGGEEKLRKLIAKAKDFGYSIVCHTNSTDAYSIADIWNENDLVRKKDGSISQNETSWSGGNMYDLCSEVALKQAKDLLPKVAELGYEGLHYIDVISTIPPRSCYSSQHPQTNRECVENWKEIMRLSRDLFGGFSSEGGYDFAAPELDYGLYVSFGEDGCPLSDERVPLWYLVYHGYVMGNPYTTTVNPTDEQFLKLAEYGGRPAVYIYSKFVTPNEERGNWMGEEDYACHTPEERAKTAEMIAGLCKKYLELAYLQTKFMDKHQKIQDNVYEITYSDGSVIIVDYNQKTYRLIRSE